MADQVKPAPTAAEVAAARYWFSGADPLREPSMGPTTRVHVAVLRAALDAAEAENRRLRPIADAAQALLDAERMARGTIPGSQRRADAVRLMADASMRLREAMDAPEAPRG